MKIVVVGGDAAGMSAASKARRMDREADILVLEQTGEVSYGACGLPYYVAGLNDDIDKMRIRTAEAFRASGIDVRTGHRVLALDAGSKTLRAVELATGREYSESYDRLMIATGAEPIRPDLPGAQLPGVHVLKTLADGEALRAAVEKAQSVVVAGGGYIGVEVAESLRGAGKQVRVIEAAPHILAPFDGEVRGMLQRRMEEHGIGVHTGEAVQAILEKNGHAAGVRTSKGDYAADVVVMAFGIRPATAFLRDSGIAMTERGAVVVDRQQRTSLPDVWAAGDCATVYNLVEERQVWSPLGTVANKCGRVAGENLAGREVEFEGSLGSAAILVCGLQAARTGMGEETARELVGEVSVAFVEDVDHAGYYPGATPIWVKLICEKSTGRLLGGQVIGEQGAALRCQALAAAVAGGLTAQQLGYLDFGYAPPFSKAWDALNIAGNAVK